MLKTTSKTKKDSFSIRFDDLDDNSLSELSSDESSEIMGGFTVNNDSGSTRAFYTLAGTVDPQRQVLQPGQSASYSGEYILYNSSKTVYEPTLSSKIGSTETASFRLEGDRVVLATGVSGGLRTFSGTLP